jgi:hypothetical protein
VTVDATPLLDLTTGTLQAWIKLDTVGRWHGVISKGSDNVDANHSYSVEVAPDNSVVCRIGNGTAVNVVQSTTKLVAQQFYHLACSWDGAALRLYIDGALNRTVSQTLTPTANDAPLKVGQYGGNVDYFDGVIDEVRISGIALPSNEIQAEMSGLWLVNRQ